MRRAKREMKLLSVGLKDVWCVARVPACSPFAHGRESESARPSLLSQSAAPLDSFALCSGSRRLSSCWSTLALLHLGQVIAFIVSLKVFLLHPRRQVSPVHRPTENLHVSLLAHSR
ncbi:Hypothetical predicted protein [Cloeon dipterum]|uniref:Transmembrane protein n=1 Tax=Cloeon dipterum TaxID=197152 RepID=A0A8S1DTR6_9INSE|nr:Hypothetical predicted protein [Cloeon dipterum]